MARKNKSATARSLSASLASASGAESKKAQGPVAAPLTFDLPVALIAKIEKHRNRLGLGSASAVVRLAIRDFDFGNYVAESVPHRQLSVRLPSKLRKFLIQTSKRKKVSLGELLRAALEHLA